MTSFTASRATPSLVRYAIAIGVRLPRSMQESTMIHSPRPRCTTTHSPIPGPKIDTSSSEGLGGVSANSQHPFEFERALASPLNFSSRPCRQPPEPKVRRSCLLPVGRYPVSDDPIENRPRLNESDVPTRNLVFRQCDFLFGGARVGKIANHGSKLVTVDLPNLPFPLLK